MKTRQITLLHVFIIAVLLLMGVVPAGAQDPRPPRSPFEPPLFGEVEASQKLSPEEQLRRAEWRHPSATNLEPQLSGGPDEFGYTWTEASLGWIDATSGVNTGLVGDEVTQLVNIGFTFKFYEQSWSNVYISTNGLLSFGSSDAGCCGDVPLPSPSSPNNIIAPYWSDLTVGNPYNSGAIYTLNGGVAPNRYFVVEWLNVTYCCDDGATDYKTFEVILFENGDIKFQSQTLNEAYFASVGIEDSRGLIGLQLPQPASNQAYVITRPAPSARVLVPTLAGAFGAPGEAAQFQQTILNGGDLGVDTYDLFPTSPWDVTLYRADGTTLLTDTDGDGTLDTGPIESGASQTIIVKVAMPNEAFIGWRAPGQVEVKSSLNPAVSKQTTFQVAVPAPFVQSYEKSASPMLGFYRPSGQRTVAASSIGYEPAVATLPDGNIIQVWDWIRTNSNGKSVSELYYGILNKRGDMLRGPTRLFDHSTASLITYDYSPSIAVAPNGTVAIAFAQRISDPARGLNYNVWGLIINSAGEWVGSPLNLTNNDQWTFNVRYSNPSTTSLGDTRFAFGWQRLLRQNNQSNYTTWYAVRDLGGGEVKAPTQINIGAYNTYDLTLNPLANGKAVLSWYASTSYVYFAQIDAAGEMVYGPEPMGQGYGTDAAQLPNGNIVLAWDNLSNIVYMVRNAEMGLIKGESALPRMSRSGDSGVSVTRASDRAVLTWGDGCCSYNPNLYYALLDGVGNVTTPPMLFTSDNTNPYLYPTYNGQGNTFLLPDITPPTNPNIFGGDHQINSWSNNNVILVNWWGAADDDIGLGGSSVAWDNAPATLPDAIRDIGVVLQTSSPALGDGQWYFHIRTMDLNGNWSPEAAHYGPYYIDHTAPTDPANLTSPSHTPNVFSNDNTITVNWASGADAGSGVSGYSVLWDTTPTTLPDEAKDLDTATQTTTSPPLNDGANWYFHIRTIDNAGNGSGVTHLGPFKIDTALPTSTARSPEFSVSTVTVSWSGQDSGLGSGVRDYSLWVRDGVTGTWQMWLTNTVATSAVYTAGLTGHTYYFRSVARDLAGNVETDLPAEGDSHTTLAALQVSGQVFNTRHQPVFNAAITADPVVLNTALSDGDGRFVLYLTTNGAYTLTTRRAGFAEALPTLLLSVTNPLTNVLLILPSRQETLFNGDGEQGDFSGWTVNAGVTPTVELTAAHTGRFGFHLAPSDVLTGFQAHLTRTLVISSAWTQPTLSWVYRVITANAGQELVARVSVSNTVISQTVPLVVGGWAHSWLDLSALRGQTVTIALGFQPVGGSAPQAANAPNAALTNVHLDEINVGEQQIGVFPLYLPVVQR